MKKLTAISLVADMMRCNRCDCCAARDFCDEEKRTTSVNCDEIRYNYIASLEPIEDACGVEKPEAVTK